MAEAPEDPSGGVEAEERAAQQLEAHRWRQKVVVADTTWHAARGGLGTGATDKARSMLHDAPQKAAIRALYRAKRPLISVMPATIFPKGEGDYDFLKSLRPSEPEKWTAANAATGEPEDFLLHWRGTGADPRFSTGPRGARSDGKPDGPRPLAAHELGNSALFGRAPLGQAQSAQPRAVEQGERFREQA